MADKHPKTPRPRTKLTRVVVVPRDGSRAQEFWADEFDVSYQDDGRTLKLFGTGDGAQAHKEAKKGFAGWIAAGVGFALGSS